MMSIPIQAVPINVRDRAAFLEMIELRATIHRLNKVAENTKEIDKDLGSLINRMPKAVMEIEGVKDLFRRLNRHNDEIGVILGIWE